MTKDLSRMSSFTSTVPTLRLSCDAAILPGQTGVSLLDVSALWQNEKFSDITLLFTAMPSNPSQDINLDAAPRITTLGTHSDDEADWHSGTGDSDAEYHNSLQREETTSCIFNAHTVVLACRSPYFDSRLFGVQALKSEQFDTATRGSGICVSYALTNSLHGAKAEPSQSKGIDIPTSSSKQNRQQYEASYSHAYPWESMPSSYEADEELDETEQLCSDFGLATAPHDDPKLSVPETSELRIGPDGKRILIEHVEQSQLPEAVNAFMRFLYLGNLTSQVMACPRTLIKVAALADRYQASSCMEACATALGQLQPHQLDVPTMAAALQLSDNLLQLKGCQQMVATCRTRLLQLFGSAASVVSDLEIRNHFLDLPFVLIKLWAAADGMEVDSENTVLLLLTDWCYGPRGSSCSMAQLQQVSELVRLRRLTPGFLHTVLPRLRWFHADPDLVDLLKGACHIEAAVQLPCLLDTMPKAWVAHSRPGIGSGSLVAGPSGKGPHPTISWVWNVPVDVLSAAVQKLAAGSISEHLVDNRVYYTGGLTLTANLQITAFPSLAKGSSKAMRLTCHLSARPGLPDSPPEVTSQLGHNWVAALKLVGTAGVGSAKPDARQQTTQVSGYGMLTNAMTVGLLEGVKRMEDLKRFTAEGRLRVQVEVAVVG